LNDRRRYVHPAPSARARIAGGRSDEVAEGEDPPDFYGSGLSSLQPRRPAAARIFFNGIGFCSLSEAVCATLLELYVPGFRVIEGETFQVDVGQGRSVDFRVQGVMCEYHGVRFRPDRRRWGDFSGEAEYRAFTRELKRASHSVERRAMVIEETRRRLASRYYERRRAVLDEHPVFSGVELVVATTVDEFYERIITRFNPHYCPTRPDFHDSFSTFASIIARHNNEGRRRRAA